MSEPDQLQMTVSSDDEQITCVAVGEIDPATATHFEGEIRAALFASTAPTLALDLSDVTFIDSSGLRVLIDLARVMQEREGTLVLRRPSSTVARLLEVTKLTEALVIEP